MIGEDGHVQIDLQPDLITVDQYLLRAGGTALSPATQCSSNTILDSVASVSKAAFYTIDYSEADHDLSRKR